MAHLLLLFTDRGATSGDQSWLKIGKYTHLYLAWVVSVGGEREHF